MLHNPRRFFLLIMLMLIVPTIALAQDDTTCPAIVETAMDTISTVCNQASRNEVCYGHGHIETTPQDHIDTFAFTAPGDIEKLMNIESMQLEAMNVENNSWGVALMRLQANLPNSLPGQDVFMLVFGDITLESASSEPTLRATVASDNPVNLRDGSKIQADLIDKVAPGTALTIVGKNEYDDWVRVLVDDGREGWMSAYLLDIEGDLSALNVIDDHAPVYTPMQAFYFSSGIGDSGCEQAPQSGILIQTPQGVGTINVNINEVNIGLGSTVYVWADPGNTMTIMVMEGLITVEAFGEQVSVPAGAKVSIPIDEGRAASGPPGEVGSYDTNLLGGLPLYVLPIPIQAAEPISIDDLEAQASCTVTAPSVARLREGPSTRDVIVGSIPAGETAMAVAQANGRDGHIWWQLDTAAWVRSDTVQASENCTALRVITETSLPAAPDPNDINYDMVTFNMSTPCMPLYPPLRVGDTISLRVGNGFETSADRDAAAASGPNAISVNGQPLATTMYLNPCGPEQHNEDRCYETHATWQPAAAGEYQAVAVDYYGNVHTCNLTVEP